MRLSMDRPDEWPPVLKVAEIAVILRVSPTTVYRLVEDEDILAMKVGRVIRVLADDLRSYLYLRKGIEV